MSRWTQLQNPKHQRCEGEYDFKPKTAKMVRCTPFQTQRHQPCVGGHLCRPQTSKVCRWTQFKTQHLQTVQVDAPFQPQSCIHLHVDNTLNLNPQICLSGRDFRPHTSKVSRWTQVQAPSSKMFRWTRVQTPNRKMFR